LIISDLTFNYRTIANNRLGV